MHLVLPQFFIFYSWGLGESLRKGFIGQYRFGVGQTHSHERQEFLDFGGLVPLSI